MFRSFPSASYFAALAALVALILSSSFVFDLVVCTRSANNLNIINGGFSVNLIHRDSPESPLRDTTILTADPFQHLNNAFQRSKQRYEQLVSTKLIPRGGEYLMKISYGTPPFESFAIVDTGSFLVWIQCLPCIHCFREKYPPFDPRSSSTFRFASTGQCPLTVSLRAANTTKHQRTNARCPYRIGYGDGSYTSGDFAYDTVTFGQGAYRVSFPNFLFGCGHDNAGFSPMQSGLVGLGPESLSLVSQLSSTIAKKFSYCLVPLVEPSKSGVLSFGDQAVVAGPGVVTTPLVINTYYSLIIQSISVGRVAKVNFSENNGTRSRRLQGGENLIIIDSGSTLTYLPTYVYKKLEEIVRSQIRSTAIPDPSGYFGLCYPSSLRDEEIPIITFHFKDAAVDLKPVNTFIRNTPTARCLAFTMSKSDSISIFGNIAHSNFLVGYDLENRSLSFKPLDCAILSN